MKTDKTISVYRIRQDIFYHACIQCPYMTWSQDYNYPEHPISYIDIGCARDACTVFWKVV